MSDRRITKREVPWLYTEKERGSLPFAHTCTPTGHVELAARYTKHDMARTVLGAFLDDERHIGMCAVENITGHPTEPAFGIRLSDGRTFLVYVREHA